MTLSAVLFMCVSVTGVVALAGWCYYRVLTTPGEHESPPPDDPED